MADLRALWQGMRRYWRLPAQARADVVRALVALAHARRQLHRIPATEIARMEDPMSPALRPDQAEIAARVAVAIKRAAGIAPWRSDCLVQALAARRWLAGEGVPTRLRVGARLATPAARPDMHAWLLCGPVVVTGGDIAEFRPFRSGNDRAP